MFTIREYAMPETLDEGLYNTEIQKRQSDPWRMCMVTIRKRINIAVDRQNVVLITLEKMTNR